MNGFLLIDKPAGLTSHDVLKILKRKLQLQKLGHTGTLDPFATGLLVVGIGEALKFLSYLNEEPKKYEAVLKLGIATDTLDCDGKIIESKSIPVLDDKIVGKVLKGFLGKHQQVPPMYSAKKIEGKKLYELAREGKTVARKPADIEIFDIEFVGARFIAPEEGVINDTPTISFRVSCSRGTYVRVLGSDIAAVLGTVGHLTSLRRTQAGPFLIENAVGLDDNWQINDVLWPLSKALSHLPCCVVTADEMKELYFGRPLSKECDVPDDTLFSLKNSDFFGVGVYRQGQIYSKRLVAVQ